jgi:hypothetical protein
MTLIPPILNGFAMIPACVTIYRSVCWQQFSNDPLGSATHARSDGTMVERDARLPLSPRGEAGRGG